MAANIVNPRVKKKHKKIGEIPAVELIPPGEERGAVIFYHGWSSCKENQLFRAGTMASFGYRIIVPDAPNHGERGKLEYDEEEELIKHFFPVVIGAVKESVFILDYLEDKLGSDVSIAASGHSMGGFIASGILAGQDRVSTGVVINGACAWLVSAEILAEKSEKMAKSKKEDQSLQVDGEREIDIRDFDPYYNISFLQEKSLLMLHGEEDSSVPLAAQRQFLKRVQSQSNNGEREVELNTYENLNHHFTTEMLAESIIWLDEKI